MDFEVLFKKRANHIKPGLERIRASYEALQKPASSIPAVLVGGTNGKGSTSGFIWSLLALSGKPIGLSSSPHLVSFSERFQISGLPLDDKDIHAAWQRLKADLEPRLYEELSFFEIATLIAFRIFEERKVAMQVLEVGLGGRWDASNISDPSASIVVSVSRDHKEFLGDDLFGILREKFAIARAGRPLFWGAQGEAMQEPGVESVVREEAAKHGAILLERGPHFSATERSLLIHLPGRARLELPCAGIARDLPPYLRNNLSLAAAFYQWHAEQQPGVWPELASIWSRFCLGEGAAPVTLAGRAQKILSRDAEPRKFLIDVCHNPDGARAFADAVLRLFPGRKLAGYVSILKDKECDAILDILRSVLHPVILFGIANERSWNIATLAARHRDLPFYETLDAALAATPQALKKEPWALCGSVAAVGEALQRMKVSPKELTLASIINGDWSPVTHES